jgi:hypothetical protein
MIGGTGGGEEIPGEELSSRATKTFSEFAVKFFCIKNICISLQLNFSFLGF